MVACLCRGPWQWHTDACCMHTASQVSSRSFLLGTMLRCFPTAARARHGLHCVGGVQFLQLQQSLDTSAWPGQLACCEAQVWCGAGDYTEGVGPEQPCAQPEGRSRSRGRGATATGVHLRPQRAQGWVWKETAQQHACRPRFSISPFATLPGESQTCPTETVGICSILLVASL